MTDDLNVESAIKTAEGLLEAGTFNLIDAVKSRTYPEKVISVATDFSSVRNAALLDTEINSLGNSAADKKRAAELEPKLDKFNKAVKDSLLTFHLRGLPPFVIDAVRAGVKAEMPEADEDTQNVEFVDRLIASHIVSVTRADGAVDKREFTRDDAKALSQYFPFESWKEIRLAMDELTFAAAYFDASVSADFLSKS